MKQYMLYAVMKYFIYTCKMASMHRLKSHGIQAITSSANSLGFCGLQVIRCPLCAARCVAEANLWLVTLCLFIQKYIKKQSHHFANKSLHSQSYDFSSSHVQM